MTTTSAFERNIDQFTEFLDGLEISDQPLPPPNSRTNPAAADIQGVLTFNNEAMRGHLESRRRRYSRCPHVQQRGYARTPRIPRPPIFKVSSRSTTRLCESLTTSDGGDRPPPASKDASSSPMLTEMPTPWSSLNE